MRSAPFTRPTLLAAVELLELHSQAKFNQVVLRLGLEDEISSSTAHSVPKKCDSLGRIVLQRTEAVLDALEGSMTLGEAVSRDELDLRLADMKPRSVAIRIRGFVSRQRPWVCHIPPLLTHATLNGIFSNWRAV